MCFVIAYWRGKWHVQLFTPASNYLLAQHFFVYPEEYTEYV